MVPMRHSLAILAVSGLLCGCSSRRPGAEASSTAPGSPGSRGSAVSALDPDAAPRGSDPRPLPAPRGSRPILLDVGDVLRFSLAFHNDSAESATVVPPLDGSWDGTRQPLYSLEYLDDDGRPVPSALGFYEPGRRGMTNELQRSDILEVVAHDDFTLDDPLRWAAPFTVQAWARPGTWKVRVRYRADDIPGVTSVYLVSNVVPLTLRGGDERLWACRNAQVERARDHIYANVTPARLAPWGDGYVVVAHRAETTVG